MAVKSWVEESPKPGPVRSKPGDVPEVLRSCLQIAAKKVVIEKEMVLEMWSKNGRLSFTKPSMPRTDSYDRPRKQVDSVTVVVPAGSVLELVSRSAGWCKINVVRGNNRPAQLNVYYRPNGDFKYAALKVGGGEVATPKTSARHISAVTRLSNAC